MFFDNTELATAYTEQNKPPFGFKWVQVSFSMGGKDMVSLTAVERPPLIDDLNLVVVDPQDKYRV